jgi:uncharacterized membrane protein
MDREEAALDDFRQEFERIDGSSSSSPGKNTTTAFHAFFRGYAMYLAFFVWTIIIVAALQPSYMYRTEESGKKRFLWKRFFLTVLLVYAGQVLVYLGVGFYQKNTQP